VRDDGTIVGGASLSDRMVEYSGMPGASALLSLANFCNVSLEEVREYARRDRLSELIAEFRSSRGLETRRFRGIDGVTALEYLARRMRLSQLNDRAARY
jgi:hypothetical protein